MKMTLLLTISILSIIISTTLLLGSHTLEAIKVGDKAPDFVLKDQDGKVHKLSDYMGSELLFITFLKRTHLDEPKRRAGSATYTANIKKQKSSFLVSVMILQKR
jgi:uncharacterized membrane protein